MHNTIYFDESGNTGDNLLDQSQPTFVLSSHDFNEDETNNILSPLLEVSDANELHFKKIRKSSVQKNALLKCLSNSIITPSRVLSFGVHKRFLIAVQIVNSLTEVFYYNKGIDFYKGGFNVLAADRFYFFGNRIWNKNLYDKLCTSFVKWVRSKSEIDGARFYTSVNTLMLSIDNESKNELIPIWMSQKYYSSIVRHFEKYYLDSTLPCFVAHCAHWNEITGKPLDIKTDPSKALSYWRGMIDYLSTEVPDRIVGYGFRRHNMRLAINSLSQCDSKTKLEIQLADLISSSVNSILSASYNKNIQEFEKKLLKSKIGRTNANSIWPSNQITKIDDPIGYDTGENPLDAFAETLMARPEAISKIKATKK